MLGSAAVVSAYRDAGSLSPRDERPLPAPGPASAGALAPPAAAAMLRQLLSDPQPALIREWLRLAAQHSVRVPEELLPPLLDLGQRQSGLQEPIAGSIGARGQWLAAQREEWAYAAEVTDPAELWQTGSREARLRALRRLRALDPAAARELLASTWEQEAPREKAAFLEVLAAAPHPGDEPFLEAALDDRRKEVREAAARILARLPSSRLVARMTERTVPRLGWIAREGMLSRLRGGRAEIRVELPEGCDAAMRRDGIDSRPAHGFGERAWSMVQMLAAVPPSFWTMRWETDPAGCIAAARAGDDARLLITGWSAAAVALRDVSWAEALLDAEVVEDRAQYGQLAALLPADRLEQRVIEQLRARKRLHSEDPAFALLQAAAARWSPALTRAVLDHLQPEALQQDWTLREALRGFALRMHAVAAVEHLRAQGDPHAGTWVELLHLRTSLHQAFPP